MKKYLVGGAVRDKLLGLEPKYYEAIINKKILKDAKFGQPTSWKFFKK